MSEQRVVQYLIFKLDSLWRRLPQEERHRGREEFAAAIQSCAKEVMTYSYSLAGLKAGADLLLWRISPSLDMLQETTSQLMQTGLGRYLETAYSLLGLTRPSIYGETEGRRYTLKDTPIFVGVHRSLEETLALLG
ncbi:chlorite dismutase family protein [Candidatus Acetothermia bacterium]|nr:chlorite dismutase family protein [Candidatus Acetothermia bacterium]